MLISPGICLPSGYHGKAPLHYFLPEYLQMEDTADDCVDIMVIGRVQKLGDRTQIYMPPTGVSFNLKERKMKLFQKVRWPVVGLLAVKDNLTAVQWALKHMGLSKKQLEALNIEQQI
ncbi:hypothetical protein Vretifemale_18734 [Volvox reticuliferus]|uniref:Uncharacterized protein n=1 Tax=Volvox reticuliferus TaxID=1737510 RepID=A0A8J4D1J2_9CHLO|nr:hypothetical protein Vretifemale_18734 [Volvox reticuliferus]